MAFSTLKAATRAVVTVRGGGGLSPAVGNPMADSNPVVDGGGSTKNKTVGIRKENDGSDSKNGGVPSRPSGRRKGELEQGGGEKQPYTLHESLLGLISDPLTHFPLESGGMENNSDAGCSGEVVDRGRLTTSSSQAALLPHVPA